MRKGILCALASAFGLLSLPAFAEMPALPEVSMSAESSGPCSGGLLAILNRATAVDSACTVDPQHVLVEGGFQSLTYRTTGTGYVLPQANIRFGLPAETELTIDLPNLFSQSNPSTRGFSAAFFGVKHELVHIKDGIFSIEGLVTLPSGSATFGSRKGGLTLTGLFAYSLTPEWVLDCSLGLASQSLPTAIGGSSFFTVNPDVVITWQPFTRFQIYGEVYGQTSTGPGQGSGFNSDGGVQYLILPDWEVDLEGGVRLTGALGGFERYVGVGTGIMF